MMSAPSFTTSKSMLMHAALAYISPELSTLNDIIQCGHNPNPATIVGPGNSKSSTKDGPHTTRIPRLPTEILLLIRECLVPEVTAARQIQSQSALRAYELALRDLLCEDCVLYNLDIYGPNVWEWEQFTSACSCREPGVPKGYRSSRPPSERRAGGVKLHHDGHDSISVSAASTDVNPKQFLDAEHWLEWHLSREATLCVGYRGHELSSSFDNTPKAISDSASEATTPSASETPAIDIDIWHVVDTLLREFGCEAVREPEHAVFSQQRAARREQFQIPSHNYVRIVPQGAPQESSTAESEALELDRDWDMRCRLNRTHRELGLWTHYPDTFSEYLFQLSAPPPFSMRDYFDIGTPDSFLKGRYSIILKDFIDTLRRLVQVTFTITVGLVTAPLTLTTFVVTILCYYSRPKLFRML
ncbi:hypothetical protein D9619_002658 [Psilocybe cf. subviscida]|uniref:Uncharacterized protein n=1 Tax=Psilocybe cf. subviscida TaxID=2480587 RepID=A0A8H5AXP7_9AGAR|nr:hypothetical protein D9619_002658 [Psilocybe cf. subviscida]